MLAKFLPENISAEFTNVGVWGHNDHQYLCRCGKNLTYGIKGAGTFLVGIIFR